MSAPTAATVKLLAELAAGHGTPGLEVTEAAGLMASWADLTQRLGARLTTVPTSQGAVLLAQVARWVGASLQGDGPAQWAARLAAEGRLRALGPAAAEHRLAWLVGRCGGDSPDARASALHGLAVTDVRLERLSDLSDDTLRGRMIADTATAADVLLTLRDAGTTAWSRRAAELLPETAALAVPVDPAGVVDRDRPTRSVLLDHLADRTLAGTLAALEAGDHARFVGPARTGGATGAGLSAGAFAREADRCRRLQAAGLMPAVRAALLHLDFAKGGTEADRARWEADLGADLTVHNLAAGTILRAHGALERFPILAARPALQRLVLALVGSHGLTGQAVRGETPLVMMLPWLEYLRREAALLSGTLVSHSPAEAARLAGEALHVVNLVDTAAVRDGLMTDGLLARFAEFEAAVDEAAGVLPPEVSARRAEDALLALEDERLARSMPGADDLARRRARVAERLMRLRRGRLDAGEPESATREAVAAVPADALKRLDDLLLRCQFWYAEAGSSALSPAGQLKLLAVGLGAADVSPAVDCGRPYHVNLQPLVGVLAGGPRADRSNPYRVRLVEALLAGATVGDLLAGKAPWGATATPAAVSPGASAPSTRNGDAAGAGTGAADAPLCSLQVPIGGTAAVELRLQESPEARALLTLLGIYETKSAVAFHTTLKSLCDLYSLRKDEFDRVANEAAYLTHMNSARSDKQRMLDHCRPGLIVEVGPGGGVVLDLLEARFPDSRILGIDASAQVVEALATRRKTEGRRWEIIEADAFRLPEHLAGRRADTVVFCSVLHEIYSYVPWPPDPEPGVADPAVAATTGASVPAGSTPSVATAAPKPVRFRLESVRELLRAVWRALAPGGRIVIRDGVMPPPGRRILHLLTPDAREFFRLFAGQFEGRPIRHEPAGTDRVAVSAADAMEFLFKLTWGPESFPYEIREQYGVLPYDDYRDRIVAWLTGVDEGVPRWVPLPPGERSWLQPGYRTGLTGKVELLDGDGRPVGLPDSNCLIVIEKAR